ncbi:hypothetical protein, variant [Aphanomyces invadans]|uniref:BZIP domain-containing protein n=1 Tax=Aphanomyces invadans TaxID=157072 RepID=A0A024U1Q8_9STRA|nr:hypothetical protein, variant [Aphanomyces invadans]ETV99532.1 hypothetical protein, variant [Aphanomyces invadans]|eukprot:XP_008872088.1 hypothetical protein, variant [Aphanomyces invadans]
MFHVDDRRDRSKINQRKYRAMMKESNAQLAANTHELELYNIRLEARLCMLRDFIGVSDCIASVNRYMQTFERGCASAVCRQDTDTYVALLREQEASIRTLCAPHVEFDGKVEWDNQIGRWVTSKQFGVDELVHRWVACRALFESVGCIECSEVDVLSITSDIFMLQTTTVKHIRVTETTLRQLFPHLDQDLAHKLIQSPGLRIPIRLVFTFDVASRLVTRLDVHSNVVVALMDTLQSAQCACDALHGAFLDHQNVVFHP